MDALALGALFRLVRVRRRLRQRDVGQRAGVSDAIVSRIEHGQLGPITHATLERVARVLEIRLDYRARWHAGDLDRLAGRDHSLLVERFAGRLGSAGWETRSEVTFAIWGDRGAVDLLAWLPAARSLLVVEVKTEITDVGETLRAFDVKIRHAAAVAASVGWTSPAIVSAALVVAETRTNRRRISAHAQTFRGLLPDTGRELRALLGGNRDRPVRAITFLSYRRSSTTGPHSAGVRRVRLAPSKGRRAA